MSAMRPPRVAGVCGGAGTTTVAQALHGVEEPCEPAGLPAPAPLHAAEVADIIVCRSYAESLARAAHIADRIDPATGPLPVLAVTLDSADRRWVRPLRLAELGPGWSAVVLLPHVRRWRDAPNPYAEAAGLISRQASGLPRELRPYAAAVSELARAVVDSGRLADPTSDRDGLPGLSGAAFLPERPLPAAGSPARGSDPGHRAGYGSGLPTGFGAGLTAGFPTGPERPAAPRPTPLARPVRLPAGPLRGLGTELRAVRGVSLVLPEQVGISA